MRAWCRGQCGGRTRARTINPRFLCAPTHGGEGALEEEEEEATEEMVRQKEYQKGWIVRQFRKCYGERPDVDLNPYVRDWMKRHPHGSVHVGCDSKVMRNRIVYAIAIVLRLPGVGGHVIYSKRSQPRHGYNNVMLRLNNEVRQSVEAAEALLDVVDSRKICVHVDLAGRHGSLSHQLHAMATGWITGVGLTPFAKPDSWAASAVAHRFCQTW